MLNKNIVLIGMPGSGKTTLGKIIARKLNKDFSDIDQHIESTQDEKISEIFEKGESVFRRIERQTIKEISERQGIVISTGGGAVKFPENIYHLKKNGIIVFIDRSLEDIIADINTGKRPLLKDGIEEIHKLHQERYVLYRGYADHIISNIGSLDQVSDAIIRLIDKNFDGS